MQSGTFRARCSSGLWSSHIGCSVRSSAVQLTSRTYSEDLHQVVGKPRVPQDLVLEEGFNIQSGSRKSAVPRVHQRCGGGKEEKLEGLGDQETRRKDMHIARGEAGPVVWVPPWKPRTASLGACLVWKAKAS